MFISATPLIYYFHFIMKRIGIDIGSTTMKSIILSEDGKIIYSDYQRHYSQILSKAEEMLSALKQYAGNEKVLISISGSAGMGIAESASIPFVQEVYSTKSAAERYHRNIDAIIELGGEDAKILFLTGGLEVRMNGTCAGGTGAFIDQMASLLGLSLSELAEHAEKAREIYTIASRCGVFAKTDIQPLINQGAGKENLAASVLSSVVNQTIGGLAQGRAIKGNILYLGGPLTFIPKLRKLFDKELEAKGICPENSLYYVALGAAISKESIELTIDEVLERIALYKGSDSISSLKPLFEDIEDYNAFIERHRKASVPKRDIKGYKGDAYLGIDAGSTTIKCALISPEGELLLSEYRTNSSDAVETVREFLSGIYSKYPDLKIKGASSTGYGEELLKTAFRLDYSLVETQAHYRGAKHFLPDVDFIIDIGGQDIKCFRIRDGAIDDIFLNEACSSGCGSFLQTFANAMGKTSEEFANLALTSKHPVDLGSRCTVFMNSSVKQAQKDGATIHDISAGLAISVVKNALYKVIRTTGKDQLGKNIVVQGGTFLNDAVLRAFEIELGCNAIRPDIAGLMGAYGAALYAREKAIRNNAEKSTILSPSELASMVNRRSAIRCKGCTNNCLLSISDFGDGRKLISGNKCEKPTGKKALSPLEDYDIYSYKQILLGRYINDRGRGEKTIGLPLALGLYELLPFYHTLFTSLGYSVITSPFSDRSLYISGQNYIPSDTVCFPAKLMHGHIEYLKAIDADTIFIPCSTYNIDEKKGTNHFNCPVVAYYGEVIKSNQELDGKKLILGFMSLENKRYLAKRIASIFDIPLKDASKAVNKAFKELNAYRDSIRKQGKLIIEKARSEKRKIIVIAGRPYHVDPEVNHSIDKVITELGASVISEDSIPSRAKKKVKVLNQWTYHARLYEAAEYSSENKDMEFVQLVSFGCGLDAVTTDEAREILRDRDRIYTQLKIDEITNAGSVRIRLRSLFAATEE